MIGIPLGLVLAYVAHLEVNVSRSKNRARVRGPSRSTSTRFGPLVFQAHHELPVPEGPFGWAVGDSQPNDPIRHAFIKGEKILRAHLATMEEMLL